MGNNIGIIILATNAYFVLGLRFIKKFNHHYKGDAHITYYFFSDENPKDYMDESIDVRYIEQKHTSWVDATNSKFKNIIALENTEDVEYLYYFDADTDITQDFTEEWFLGDLVGGEHYGNRNFLSDGKGFDRNPIGNSYVPLDSKLPYTYHYGAFFGGLKERVTNFCKTLTEWQNIDQAIGYEPPVNDESYINKYFHYNPPTYIVSCENFKFVISDKGGLGETRNTNLDVSQMKQELKANKNRIFNLTYNKINYV